MLSFSGVFSRVLRKDIVLVRTLLFVGSVCSSSNFLKSENNFVNPDGSFCLGCIFVETLSTTFVASLGAPLADDALADAELIGFPLVDAALADEALVDFSLSGDK